MAHYFSPLLVKVYAMKGLFGFFKNEHSLLSLPLLYNLDP